MLSTVRWMAGIAIAVWLLAGWCGGSTPAPSALRLGTFNIRMFPETTTDADAVAARLAELDADAFGVEEIRDPRAFAAVLKTASARTGRDYAFTYSRYCVRRYEMYLGVVYDRHRVRLREERPLAGERRCAMDHPSAHAAVLEAGGETLALVAVHLKSGGNVAGWHRRRTQWRHLVATYRALERELDVPVIFAGDFNTTGLRDDSGGERSDIERMLGASRLALVTRDLRCTAYWRPGGGDRYAPSTLDHFLARSGHFTQPVALGMCARLACRDHDGPPPDYRAVSDHCPVVTTWRP